MDPQGGHTTHCLHDDQNDDNEDFADDDEDGDGDNDDDDEDGDGDDDDEEDEDDLVSNINNFSFLV